MAKSVRKVGRPKKSSKSVPKPPQPGPKRTRTRYPISIKKKVVSLRNQGMTLNQIDRWLQLHEKLYVKKPTLCTWYNTKNTLKMEAIGDLGKNNNDTCVSGQRPRIVVDTETVLSIHVRRSQENGLPLSLQACSIAGAEVYLRLKKLGIYLTNGQRAVKTHALTESHINSILHKNDPDVEITDVHDPHYEDPNTKDTNEMLINSVSAYHDCLLCDKKVYNRTIFAKHLNYHT